MDYKVLIDLLFQTKAVRVCPKDKPFWYTSNKIGPYYINTHFLYGSEEKANAFLKVIDANKDKLDECSSIFMDCVLENYNSDSIYKTLIDLMVGYINENIDLASIDFISGGERRDWFFSLIIAYLVKKPHITIFKDKSYRVFEPVEGIDVPDIKGARVLHIADIITEASSYARAWDPAVLDMGAKITDSLVVIDRLQGGKEVLEGLKIKSHSLIDADKNLFDTALKNEYINESQYNLVKNFIDNPFESMRDFLINHPEFLEEALKSDEKTAKRAEICVKENLYNL